MKESVRLEAAVCPGQVLDDLQGRGDTLRFQCPKFVMFYQMTTTEFAHPLVVVFRLLYLYGLLGSIKNIRFHPHQRHKCQFQQNQATRSPLLLCGHL